MILTMGTALTDDVESGLHLTEVVDPGTQNGAMIVTVVKAAESHVKLETKRNFEETDFVDQAYDVDANTIHLLLTDRPIISITSIAEVTARNEDGTLVTRVLSPGEYIVNKKAGIVSKLSGPFMAGRQAVIVNWTAGYTPEQIQSSATSDIKVLKQVCLSITQNWHTKRQKGVGAYTTMSAPNESASFNFDLTPDEKRMIHQLRRE